MKKSVLIMFAIIPLAIFSCKKDKDPEYTNSLLYGVWVTSAAGEDANADYVFDADERVPDNGSYEWTFRSDDSLIIRSRVNPSAPVIREWYRVDGTRFYRTASNGGSSDIIRLSSDRFLLRTEAATGFNAAWLELRRL